MTFEESVLGLPVTAWRPGLTIALDYYDGAREGLCRLLAPAVEFRFRLIAERINPDDVDDRLFLLEELPAGSVERVRRALSELGQPTGTVWVPIWRFATPHAEEAAGRAP